MNSVFPDKHQVTKLRVAVAVLLVGLLLVGSALRSFGLLIDDIYRLQEGLGGDKMAHIMMGVALMASGLLGVFPKSTWSVGALLLAVLGLLSVDELAQTLSKTRELDLFDFFAGCTGAILLAAAFTAGMYLHRYMRRSAAKCNEPAKTE